MNIPMLAVDKNIDVSLREQAGWLKHGISTIRIDTMLEAIEQLSKRDFLFTAINADNIIYQPLLRTMRSIAPTPILIITSDFKVSDQIAALRNGADAYVPFHENVAENVESALAMLLRCNERNKQPKKQANMMIYGDFLVGAALHQVFCNDMKLTLTKKEYDILYYLIANHGYILTYKQIYRKVWGVEYDETGHGILWSHIRRLREKISQASRGKEYIINERNVGYRFLISYDK